MIYLYVVRNSSIIIVGDFASSLGKSLQWVSPLAHSLPFNFQLPFSLMRLTVCPIPLLSPPQTSSSLSLSAPSYSSTAPPLQGPPPLFAEEDPPPTYFLILRLKATIANYPSPPPYLLASSSWDLLLSFYLFLWFYQDRSLDTLERHKDEQRGETLTGVINNKE